MILEEERESILVILARFITNLESFRITCFLKTVEDTLKILIKGNDKKFKEVIFTFQELSKVVAKIVYYDVKPPKNEKGRKLAYFF